MNVVKLLPPEPLRADRDGMARGLPETPVSVRASGLPVHIGEHAGLVPDGIVGQGSTRVSAEFVESLPKTVCVVLVVEDYRVHVSGHHDICIDAQTFVGMTESKALREKTAGPFTHKHGEPADYAICDEVDGRIVVNAVYLHGGAV
ncbi:MAG: hypothetical protein K1Y02_21155 [Candidatus Hydrogenedentes bacterium]|nr:hypothetical protein [Candidatus Hydrogenedentota bacterium]